MMSKFKDFLKTLGSRFKLGSKKSGSAREAADDDSQLENSTETELLETAEPSAPHIKLTKLNRFSPYTYKLKQLMLPVSAAFLHLFKRGMNETGVGKSLQKVDWGSLIDRVLSKDSLTHHHRVFLTLLLLLTTFSVGKIAALFLKGRPEFPTLAVSRKTSIEPDFRASDLNQFRASDPFRTKAQTSNVKVADKKCDEGEEPTALPIKLVNAIVLQDSVKSLAAVQLRSGRDLKQVREGDTLEGMAKITRISRLELVIKNLQTGACELVLNEKMKDPRGNLSLMTPMKAEDFRAQQKMLGIENQGNKYVIAKDLLDEKLKDISVILTQARAIKIQNPDGTLSFKLAEVEPGGVFSYLGLQNEDIITSINGKPISDLNEVMAMFGRIKNLDQLQLGIRREGEETLMDYQMKQ